MRGRFVSKQRERKYDSIKRGIRQRWENTKIAETHSYSKIASTNETIESDDCHSVDNVPVDLEEVEIVYTIAQKLPCRPLLVLVKYHHL